MESIVRLQKHLEHEIKLGHKVSYTHYESRDINNYAISVTANDRGFVPLSAVLRHFNIPIESIMQIIAEVNKYKVIRVFRYTHKHPAIILVPRTFGSSKEESKVEYYISNIISYCNYMNIQQLQFMHYSFVNKELQADELRRILKVVLNPIVQITLKRFIWEIDSRSEKQFMSIYDQVANRIFSLGVSKPRIIYAREFEYVDDPQTYGTIKVKQFRLKKDAVVRK